MQLQPFVSLVKTFRKSNSLDKLFYTTTFALCIVILANYAKPQIEGLKETRKFIVKNGTNVYDDFYVSIYDDLLYSSLKNKYEIGKIINIAKPAQQSRVLDIGSGTGHHVNLLTEQGLEVIGLEISPSMINHARKQYPSLNFQQGNALNGQLYSQNSFSLITCLYFTIYYIKNKRRFFQNCINWLMPGGCLALHLVDRNKFDPMIPAGDPLAVISAQNYAKERITTSVIEFDTYNYKSKFDLDAPKNMAVLNETFKNKINGNVRKNEHTFYMESQKDILAIVKSVGFILLAQIDLTKCQYENQFVYVLQKPN